MLLTYVSPYTYISYGILYNNLSDTVNDYVRVARSEMDAYPNSSMPGPSCGITGWLISR